MTKYELYSLHPPHRNSGTVIHPTDHDLRVPAGYPRIPGYLDKMREVLTGLRAPFWGTQYALNGRGNPPDFVRVSPFQFGVSEALKELLLESGALGLHFHPVRVGECPMFILGVEGRVGIQPAPMELRLLDGAEVGLYEEAEIYVSARLANMIKGAKLEMSLEPPILEPDYSGPS